MSRSPVSLPARSSDLSFEYASPTFVSTAFASGVTAASRRKGRIRTIAARMANNRFITTSPAAILGALRGHIVKLIPAERVAQVCAAHARIVDDLPRPALLEHPAIVDNQRPVAHPQRLGHVVVRDQHALAELL